MRETLSAVLALVALQASPPPFLREGVSKIFENDRVVAWQVESTQARPTPMHQHTMDLVAVAGEAGLVRFQQKGIMHTEDSVTATGKAIVVELKDAPVPARTPNTTAPEGFPREGARLVLDNARVAVWDYQWLPARPVGLHIHNRDTVVVPLEAGEIRVQFRNGETRITRLVLGQLLYFSGADAHSEAASLGSPRAIAIELK